MKNLSDNSRSTTVTIASISLTIITASLLLKKRLKANEKEIQKLQELREAERKGRIKAEILLRSTIKDNEEKRFAASSAFYNSKSTGGDKETKHQNKHDMLLRCVGEVVSPFVKRMGTPRQGALAPHARGYIQLNQSVAPMETLSGIDLYSHAWVLFCFHANTDCQSLSVKTKVRPPRAGGLKVGNMATRSPHRPNPIGLSLVKILSVDEKKKRLHIAALDLVNGTPVYDIKPCVPWDIPGHFDGKGLSVPDWVSQEDALSEVSFTPEAELSLKKLIEDKVMEPLYTLKEDGINNVREAIKEVLSQDPRAAKRRGKVDNSRDPYKVSFGPIQLEFLVVGKGQLNVVKMSKIEFDDCIYVDGVPLAKDGTMS